VLKLTVIEGPDQGKAWELPANEPQLIGRSSEALAISDETVSRRHAELTPDNGAWYIRDLHSQNGTYINGQQAKMRLRLEEGDRIRVGSTVFQFGTPGERPEDVVRVIKDMDVAVEAAIRSGDDPLGFHPDTDDNEDSVILAEPEPLVAAADHLRIIYELTTLTTRATDRRDLLKAVMEIVFHEFAPERGFIMLRDPGETDTAPMKPAVVKYHQQPVDKDAAKINVSRTILHHAIRDSEGVLATNAMTDPRFQAGDSVQSFNIRSAICSPVTFRDRIFGAIYVDSSMANFTFTKEQLALMNAIGRHTGLALANIDLLGEKLQAERLAAIGETVASLSHSIKNILQGLRGGADVVEMGLNKQDFKVAKGGWDILKRNLNRIIALTVNMLAFSRQRVVEPELVKLDSFLEECGQLFEKAGGEKNIAIIVDADPDAPPVPLDPHLMHQAMLNLIGNAIDASGAGAVVTVSARYEVTETSLGPISPTTVIEVRDTGPGIPADRLKWIFEPFHTTKGLRGTGLGLAVTKRIVEDHRGTIDVESEPGAGTTFIIRIPAAPPDQTDPSETAETSSASHDPTIRAF